MSDKRKIIILFLAFIFVSRGMLGSSSALSLNKTERQIEIKGPVIISLKKLGGLETLRIDDETVIHLPDSAQLVMVEKYQIDTEPYEKEIRTHTIQHAFFWALTTLILVQTWNKTF